jgi:hypothetical protein
MSFAQLIFGFFIAACSFKRQSGIQTSKHGFHRLKVVLKSLLTIVVYHSMFNGAAVDELVKDAMHFTLPSSVIQQWCATQVWHLLGLNQSSPDSQPGQKAQGKNLCFPPSC